MKKLLNSIFYRKHHCSCGDSCKCHEHIVGITQSDYIKIHNDIVRAYNDAHERQKSTDAKPTGYMRGLKAALDILDTIKPYNLEVK